jgi:hypothetical protein
VEQVHLMRIWDRCKSAALAFHMSAGPLTRRGEWADGKAWQALRASAPLAQVCRVRESNCHSEWQAKMQATQLARVHARVLPGDRVWRSRWAEPEQGVLRCSKSAPTLRLVEGFFETRSQAPSRAEREVLRVRRYPRGMRAAWVCRLTTD